MNNIIEIYCDGGSRGNPGEAGIGVVIKQNQESGIKNKEDVEIGKYIGVATNNQAEYKAVIEALKHIESRIKNQELSLDGLTINFFLDSQLVVEQMNGNYKIKNEGLKPLYLKAQELINKINGNISFFHVRRDKNSYADKLVNHAIDNKIN